MKKIRIIRTLVISLMIMMLAPAPAQAAEVTGTLTNASGTFEVTGKWVKKSGKVFFRTSSVSKARGWLKIGKAVYYLKKNGSRVTGLAKIRGKYYYFRKNGKQRKGLIVIGGHTYYFDPEDGGARTGEGTKVINGITYTFTKEGRTRVNTYDDNGTFYDGKGHAIQKATLTKLLKTAMKPVGQTMYIWGGGWNTSSSGGIIESTTIGVQPRWKAYFKKQNSSYDYRRTRWQAHDGLDCSGYVAWVLYNTFNTESGFGSFLMGAQFMAKTYANWGWGSFKSARAFTDWRAGDIMSLASGHVYIVIGKCADGSVVLVHSSPKGVMINGTVSRSGKVKSKAWKLARKYMMKYFPAWYAKYPDVSRGSSYLNSYGRMRWYLGRKKSVMSDPDGLRRKNAAQVLKVIFGE